MKAPVTKDLDLDLDRNPSGIARILEMAEGLERLR